MDNTLIQKPILKWVGGKSQIINKLIPYFPKKIENYHDIFVGGGSVLIALLSMVKNGSIELSGKVYAYDLNETLIKLYKIIQTNHIELYSSTKKIVEEYNSCKETDDKKKINRNPHHLEEAMKYKENYYYWIRNNYNKKDINEGIEKCSMFIFLNKTCFRGLYRVGPNGFNVPFGNYKNPEVLNFEHLKEIHYLIKDVVFEYKHFNHSLEQKFNQNDFVYLDPPYVPEKKTSFVGYNENGFNSENHIQLFKKINDLETKFMLNNSNVKLVRDSFDKNKYNIYEILCKRTINSKNPSSKSIELIIMKK
jgi:DNA adenine methylase